VFCRDWVRAVWRRSAWSWCLSVVRDRIIRRSVLRTSGTGQEEREHKKEDGGGPDECEESWVCVGIDE